MFSALFNGDKRDLPALQITNNLHFMGDTYTEGAVVIKHNLADYLIEEIEDYKVDGSYAEGLKQIKKGLEDLVELMTDAGL